MGTLRQFIPSAAANPVLLLSAEELARVLTAKLCFEALLQAYRDLAEDPASAPKTLGFKGNGGSFHIKAGLYPKTRDFFAAKLNANFPGNAVKGLPTIQGLVLLTDAMDGQPLAVLDSGELTAIRTAAAAALGAKFGARSDAKTATVIGCGRQAGYALTAIARIFSLETVFAFDANEERAAAFAEAFRGRAAVQVEAVGEVGAAARQSDIIVTCTTSKEPVLFEGQVSAGAFIAAIGADNPEKQELDPALFKNAAVLTDDMAQCAAYGDLHHALEAKAVTESDVRAELVNLAAGRVKGRQSADEIVIYDSTGTGLQDVAAARAAFRAATGA
jgi:alanine dehydrogenase